MEEGEIWLRSGLLQSGVRYTPKLVKNGGESRNHREIALAAGEDFSTVFGRFRTEEYSPLYRDQTGDMD
jgi:hypothetical protein